MSTVDSLQDGLVQTLAHTVDVLHVRLIREFEDLSSVSELCDALDDEGGGDVFRCPISLRKLDLGDFRCPRQFTELKKVKVHVSDDHIVPNVSAGVRVQFVEPLILEFIREKIARPLEPPKKRLRVTSGKPSVASAAEDPQRVIEILANSLKEKGRRIVQLEQQRERRMAEHEARVAQMEEERKRQVDRLQLSLRQQVQRRSVAMTSTRHLRQRPPLVPSLLAMTATLSDQVAVLSSHVASAIHRMRIYENLVQNPRDWVLLYFKRHPELNKIRIPFVLRMLDRLRHHDVVRYGFSLLRFGPMVPKYQLTNALGIGLSPNFMSRVMSMPLTRVCHAFLMDIVSRSLVHIQGDNLDVVQSFRAFILSHLLKLDSDSQLEYLKKLARRRSRDVHVTNAIAAVASPSVTAKVFALRDQKNADLVVRDFYVPNFADYSVDDVVRLLHLPASIGDLYARETEVLVTEDGIVTEPDDSYAGYMRSLQFLFSTMRQNPTISLTDALLMCMNYDIGLRIRPAAGGGFFSPDPKKNNLTALLTGLGMFVIIKGIISLGVLDIVFQREDEIVRAMRIYLKDRVCGSHFLPFSNTTPKMLVQVRDMFN